MRNGTRKGLAAAQHGNIGRGTSPYYKTLSLYAIISFQHTNIKNKIHV